MQQFVTMKLLIIVMLYVASCQAISFWDVIHQEWKVFKIQFNKMYDSDMEEQFRMKIFMQNKNTIAQHNAKFAKGLASYKLSVNEYTDQLHSEFRRTKSGLLTGSVLNSTKTNKLIGAKFITPANVKLPDSIDWRKFGAVTPVKSQGLCGSCWAFSAIGSLEAQHFRHTGVLVSLSEQNLVDCSRPYGNNGCNGGYVDAAFQYIKDNRGIDTEMSYPYVGKEKKCHYGPKNVGAEEVGFVDIPKGNEEKLMAAVATVGPVSVAADTTHPSVQFYSEGIYDEPACRSDIQDHAMLVVGYGTENGKDYWLVKNSWGTSWGDKGYIKMSRNKNNQCGIATTASYPLV